MAKILDMPKLSPTMEEGVLATWHKKEGDTIQVDDLLAEVETDKATMEFRAFDKGTILKLLVDAGASVKLGQPVAIVGNPGEDVSGLLAQAGAPPPAAKPEPSAKPEEEERPVETPRSPPAPAPPPPAAKGDLLTRTERDAGPRRTNGERPLASPYVRKIARERGVDLSAAHGSGEHGRILPSDLDRTPEPAPMVKAPAPAGSLLEPEARPLSQMRKAIARRLTQSKQTVPHFYLTIDVDAAPLAELRERINAELAAGKRPEGEKPEKISFNDLVIKAAAAALVRVPECNAQFSEQAILVHRRVDISVAVAVPDGLLTPVVRNADQKSVVAIGREVRDLAARARAKKLKPEEMSDGTFSISNLGMFGIDAFSAVINPPEGAILAVGQTRDEPVVKDGAVVPGKRLAMTLSCDHRVVDGAIGAAFLAELRALVEHPMRILTG
jgi:pyruvate dehydrogenase E2 component (dihydrolipoamide acetyltransferase)